jgi:hypothetical protein
MKKLNFLVLLMLIIILASAPLAAAANGNSGGIVTVVGNIVVPEGQVVQGDVVAIFGNIEVHGEVNGNAVSVLGNVTVSSTGKVWGDGVSVVGNLVADSDSSISGNVINILGTNGNFDLTNLTRRPVNIRYIFRNALHFNGYRALLKLGTGILLAILIVVLFPVPVSRVRKSIEGSPGRMILIGLLVWVAAIPAIIIVALTLIGIPLAFLIGAALWAGGKFGAAALVLMIGQALLKDKESEPAAAALGALLLGVTTFIPFIGGLIGLGVSLLTVGAVTITRFGTRDEAPGPVS